MTPEEIGNRLSVAKSRLNASKGQADGLLHDAQSKFIGDCIAIIDQLLTEIAQLQGRLKKETPVPVQESKKKK